MRADVEMFRQSHQSPAQVPVLRIVSEERKPVAVPVAIKKVVVTKCGPVRIKESRQQTSFIGSTSIASTLH